MMNNHLLSESCSTENYREYGAMIGRARSDYFKRERAQKPAEDKQTSCFDVGSDHIIRKNDQQVTTLFEEIKLEKKSRQAESENDALSIG